MIHPAGLDVAVGHVAFQIHGLLPQFTAEEQYLVPGPEKRRCCRQRVGDDRQAGRRPGGKDLGKGQNCKAAAQKKRFRLALIW